MIIQVCRFVSLISLCSIWLLNTAGPNVDRQNVPRHGNSLKSKAGNSVHHSNEMADSNVESGGQHFRVQAVNANHDLNGGEMQSNADDDEANDEYDGNNSNTENAVEVRVKQEVKTENEFEAYAMDLPMIQFDPNDYNARRVCSGTRILRSRVKTNRFRTNSSSSAQKQRNRKSSATKPIKSKMYGNDCHRKPYDGQRQQLRGRPKSTKTTNVPCEDNKFVFDCGRCMRLFSVEMERSEHEQRCRKQRYECRRCNKFVTANRLSMLRHTQSRCA